PSLSPQAADAHSPWHDTDIQAPPEDADDEPLLPHGEGDWPVDVWLDLALPARDPMPAPPPLPEAKPVAAPFAESEPMPWPEEASLPEPAVAAPVAPPAPSVPVPVPVPAPVPVPVPPPPLPAPTPAAAVAPPPVPSVSPSPTPAPAPVRARNAAAFEAPSHEPPTFDFPRLDAHTERPGTTARGAAPAGNGVHTPVPPGGRVEPTLFIDPPAAAPPPPPPRAPPPPPPASGSPFGAWPPAVADGAPAPGPRVPPPWLSEADVEHMRRMQERGSRWPGLLGLAVYMVVLLAGAWWVARWIIDSQRVETRQRPLPETTAVPAPVPGPAPAPSAAPAPAPSAAPVAAPPTAAAAQPAAAPPPTAAPAVRGLGFAWPPESGSAAALVDELMRVVATPAGVTLRAPAANEPPALTLMRTDALMAARATNTPLRVVAPLYNEQVQVLVRTDARWDYVREIRGLRLNIGRADGARARTARALYQQLFGAALPAAQTNELDLDAALRALQERGAPFDAIVVVSESPVESQLQPAAQRQVRELTIEGRQGAVTSLPGFSVSRRTSNDRARLSTTSYLVAPGAPQQAQDALLRTLALALCRAQPQLQKQESALLRGFRPNQQPDVGYPYLLPRTPEGSCPAS
ncbi:MAG TPA: TAXI family TRAP transporter solute-binding subunit, partial [Burkholderiaceae bacterium]|nr:TAXI family TRAP transporter solute-binding subunit [Burkholderiaceae bacterium]